MPKLKFYDVKDKKSFTTDEYTLTSKKNPKTKRIMYMAKTTAPSGVKANVFVSKDFYEENK